MRELRPTGNPVRDVYNLAVMAGQVINLHLNGVEVEVWTDETVRGMEAHWAAQRALPRAERTRLAPNKDGVSYGEHDLIYIDVLKHE